MSVELQLNAMARPKSAKEAHKSIDSGLTEYTQETTIHGLKYLGERNHSLPQRVFWITIFIVSMSCLGYFMYKICKVWMEHPVMITERNTPTQIYEIPLPAVTVCPAIKTKHNLFDILNIEDEIRKVSNISTFWTTEYGKQFLMATQICRRSLIKYSKPFFDAANENLSDVFANMKLYPELIQTLYDFSPQREEVVKRCRISNWNWEDKSKTDSTNENCESLFSRIVTNEGVCFTFNTVDDVLRTDSLHNDFKYFEPTDKRDGWHPETGYTKNKAYPYKGIVRGSFLGTNGLKFVLVSNTSDLTPLCEPYNLGYKLVFNSPTAYPHMYGRYMFVEYGKEYKISIIPKTIYTAEDLRSFDPESRQCYFNDERRLKFFTFYNEENCHLECYANFSLKMYGGVPFSSPRDADTKNYLLQRRNYGWDLPKFYDLLNNYNNDFSVPKDILGETIPSCDCLPECNSILYDYEVLKTYDDIWDIDQFKTENGSDIVRTTIDMFFSEPHFIGQKRVRVYTFETLVSDFGGLLGLFMGGSLLSFFELIYFLTIRNCFKQSD